MRLLATALCFMGGLVITSSVAKAYQHPHPIVMLIFLALPIAFAIWGWHEFKD